MDWKEFIIPQTVPNKPIKGAVEPIVARYVKFFSTFLRYIFRNFFNIYATEKSSICILMQNFIRNNAPWDQLVKIKNIDLQLLKNDSVVQLNKRINITPFLVPHRDEYSETVGYKINANKKTVIFIPDINKWEQWEINISELIKNIDYAFLDATFYKNGELERDMSEIPHPFVEESMELFSKLSEKDKKKIHFIHFNHTNPLLQENSSAQKEVLKKGFNIAKEGQIINL